MTAATSDVWRRLNLTQQINLPGPADVVLELELEERRPGTPVDLVRISTGQADPAPSIEIPGSEVRELAIALLNAHATRVRLDEQYELGLVIEWKPEDGTSPEPAAQ